jgi:RNA polymerase sigma-70 factor, ECF subfamily
MAGKHKIGLKPPFARKEGKAMRDCNLEFQDLHHDLRPRILRYATRLVGAHEAEDLTQEVFLKVSQGLKDFRGQSQISTWIYRIATNAAFDRLHSPSFKRIVRQGTSGFPVSEIDMEVEDKDLWSGQKAPSIDTLLIRKEMNLCIRDFVEELPSNYRAVVVLSELEGMKNNEIAEILGVSLHTVKIRLHRAKDKLRKELETHCSFYRDERNEPACDRKTTLEDSLSGDGCKPSKENSKSETIWLCGRKTNAD